MNRAIVISVILFALAIFAIRHRQPLEALPRLGLEITQSVQEISQQFATLLPKKLRAPEALPENNSANDNDGLSMEDARFQLETLELELMGSNATEMLNAGTLSSDERNKLASLFEKRIALHKRLLQIGREQLTSQVNQLQKEHASRLEQTKQDLEDK